MMSGADSGGPDTGGSASNGDLKLTTDCSHRISHNHHRSFTAQLMGPRIVEDNQLSEPYARRRLSTGSDTLNNTYPFIERRRSRDSQNRSFTYGVNHDSIRSDILSSDESGLKLTLDTSHRKYSRRLIPDYSRNVFDLQHSALFMNYRKPSYSDSISEAASVKSDLQLSLDCSHRRPKSVIRNSLPLDGSENCFIAPQSESIFSDVRQSNPATQYFDKCQSECDLQLSTDCRHRTQNHGPSLENGRSKDDRINGQHKAMNGQNNYFNVGEPSVDNIYQDLATPGLDRLPDSRFMGSLNMGIGESDTYSHYRDHSIGSPSDPDLQLSVDCSHRRCVTPATDNLRLSLDCSHRRRRSLTSAAVDRFDAVSVSSDLQISTDTSHRTSTLQKGAATSLMDSGIVNNVVSVGEPSNKHPDVKVHQETVVSGKKENSNCDIVRNTEIKGNVDNDIRIPSGVMAERSDPDKEQGNGGEILPRPGQDSSANIRKKRKRFRSGSDSNLMIQSKKMTFKTAWRRQTSNGNESVCDSDLLPSSRTCDRNILKPANTDNTKSSLKHNINRCSKTWNKLPKDVSINLDTVKEIPVSVEKKNGRCNSKRNSWPGVDRKQQFIQKVHKAIARVDHSMGSTVSGKADNLNISSLESMMPLNEVVPENDRKSKTRFMRKNGVLYRRHDNGAIWETVISKFVS